MDDLTRASYASHWHAKQLLSTSIILHVVLVKGGSSKSHGWCWFAPVPVPPVLLLFAVVRY